MSGTPKVGGILVVDKPVGPTSFDVVNQAKRALGAKKAGHTGTLDPAATGVLAICIDEGVKLQQFLTEQNKVYDAEVTFGVATDSQDREGRVVAESHAGSLTQALLEAALPRFIGDLQQVPPMFSAVRVGGKRLYEAARAGEEVDRAARPVRIDAIELLAFDAGSRARASLRVSCGKGTYIRTLAFDLGASLGLPSHLSALRRLQAGAFRIADAVPLADLERLGRAVLLERLIAPAAALGHLPLVTLTDAEVRAFGFGQTVPREPPTNPGLARAVNSAGTLVAVCRWEEAALKPVRVFAGAPAGAPID